jgi:hypothetical protein
MRHLQERDQPDHWRVERFRHRSPPLKILGDQPVRAPQCKEITWVARSGAVQDSIDIKKNDFHALLLTHALHRRSAVTLGLRKLFAELLWAICPCPG